MFNIVNCELWSCYMNSTLGSVVPLAMFSYRSSECLALLRHLFPWLPPKYGAAPENIARLASLPTAAVSHTEQYTGPMFTEQYTELWLHHYLWTWSDRRHNQSFRNCFPGRWMWRLEALPIWLLGQFIVVFETTWTMCLSSNKTSYSCDVFNHIL